MIPGKRKPPPTLNWVVFVLLWIVSAADAQEALDQTTTFNLIEENDSFWTNVDRHYTQGLRFSLASAEAVSGSRVGIADHLILAGKSTESPGKYRYSVSFGQSIFTPENLALVTPDSRDRPYAGWLYVSTAFYRESANVLDRAEITIGLVGPDAQAEEVQNTWHDITRDYLKQKHVNGWGAQLRNEPGLVFTQERKWRFASSVGAFDVDFLPEVNASVGNVFTYGAVGFLARFGQRISVDWGPPRVQPGLSGSDFVNRGRLAGRSVAWYFFAGVEERAVARNIFLDGNSFKDSASVKREPLVTDFTGGVAAVFPIGRASLSYVRRTDEFKTQVEDDQFVSISLSILF